MTIALSRPGQWRLTRSSDLLPIIVLGCFLSAAGASAGPAETVTDADAPAIVPPIILQLDEEVPTEDEGWSEPPAELFAAADSRVIELPPNNDIDSEAVVYDQVEPADEAVMQEMRRCCSCCPQWPNYFVFDALLLQRDNATNGQPIALSSNRADPATLLTTRDLQFPVAAGTRLLYGHRGPHGVGWEVGYLGVYGMTARQDVNGIDGEAVPGDIGQTVPGWATADVIAASYMSTLNIAEANVFLFNCCEACDPCATLQCRRTRHCRCTDFLAGFFWAGLDESSTLDVTCCQGDPPSPYAVRSTSNLFGAQLGLRRRVDWCRWALEGTAKAGLAGTSVNQSSGPIRSTLTGDFDWRNPEHASGNGVGFLSMLNATAIYRISSHWGVRAGYNLIWLGGVALAPNQWDFNDTLAAGSGINYGGSLFLHGVNLGLERRW